MRLGLVKGSQITPNIVDRATTIIKKHIEEKGFKNAEVNIKQTDDLTHENEVIVDIYVDKKDIEFTLDQLTEFYQGKLKSHVAGNQIIEVPVI